MSFTSHECSWSTPPAIKDSTTDPGTEGNRSWKSRWNIRTWDIWRLPIAAVVYVVTVEVLALLATGWYAAHPRPAGDHELISVIAIAVCSSIHLHYSRFNESDRRHFNRHREIGPHIDFASVWILPAAVLLQPALFVATVLWIRVQRYLLAPRPTHRYIFSTASIVLAGLTAGLVLRGIAVTDIWSVPPTTLGGLRQTAATAAAMISYGGTQLLLIAGAAALGTPAGRRSTGRLFGTWQTNQLDALILGMGTVAAIAAAHLPLLIIGLVPFAIKANRLFWIEQLVQSERDLREGNQQLARQARELAAQAGTDPLTGVLNVRGFQSRSAEIFARHPIVAGIAVDLDFFKQVNDTWGHAVGDEALRATARVLRERVRDCDIVARVGGEEFVLLLPDCELDDAAAVAERIRAGVSDIRLQVNEAGQTRVITPITASIGVGVHPFNASGAGELINAVDQAVYAAKRAGRNQVSIASAEPRLPQSHAGVAPSRT